MKKGQADSIPSFSREHVHRGLASGQAVDAAEAAADKHQTQDSLL